MVKKGYRIGLVVSEYNFDITMMMMERARAHAEFLGCEITKVVKVPGVFDIPFALNRVLMEDGVDGCVAIGAVIEGETDHDEVVIQHAARKVMDIALERNKPIGLGISGPGMSRSQAQARIENARSAVEAVVKLLDNT